MNSKGHIRPYPKNGVYIQLEMSLFKILKGWWQSLVDVVLMSLVLLDLILINIQHVMHWCENSYLVGHVRLLHWKILSMLCESHLGIHSIIWFTWVPCFNSFPNCCIPCLWRLVHGCLVEIHKASSATFITCLDRPWVFRGWSLATICCHILNG